MFKIAMLGIVMAIGLTGCGSESDLKSEKELLENHTLKELEEMSDKICGPEWINIFPIIGNKDRVDKMISIAINIYDDRKQNISFAERKSLDEDVTDQEILKFGNEDLIAIINCIRINKTIKKWEKTE